MVARIQGSKPRVRYAPAAVTYALMAVGLYHFIIRPGRSVADAFVLGVVIYGVFDGTNMALFSRYSPLIAVQDALWGGAVRGNDLLHPFVPSSTTLSLGPRIRRKPL